MIWESEHYNNVLFSGDASHCHLCSEYYKRWRNMVTSYETSTRMNWVNIS